MIVFIARNASIKSLSEALSRLWMAVVHNRENLDLEIISNAKEHPREKYLDYQ